MPSTRSRLGLLLLALSFVLVSGPALADGADRFPARCAGTYLVEEAGGARDFWTVAADGSFFGTTSTQPLFDFSNQQGSWRKDGREGAKGVLLAFVWDEDDELQEVARIDIAWAIVGRTCREIAGAHEVRLFTPDEDPLGPEALDREPAFTDTFTGRRMTVPGPGKADRP